MITPAIERYLSEIRIPLRLACVTETGWPMILSLWFLYESEQLYCATKQSAKVVGYLRHNPQCAFEVAADDPPYCGVRGQANVTLNKQLGPEILERLLLRYVGSLETPLARKLTARSDQELAIIIEPVNLFQWNFSKRMRDSLASDNEKLCP